jgi:uncharacterized damage-inducible protein DinB
MRPAKNTYPQYYGQYIDLAREDNILDALKNNQALTCRLLTSIPAEKEEYVYAPGKWTIKQVISHINDTERVFSYRSLRFARKDPQQPLPFDEDKYAAAAELSNRSISNLLEEFDTVRKSTILFFVGFSSNTLLNSGQTAIGPATVLALGYIICGHTAHHTGVITSRYL